MIAMRWSVVAVMLLSPVPVWARGGAKANYVTGNNLLIGYFDQPDIQKELGLTAEQIVRAEKASDTASQRLQKASQEAMKLKPAERQKLIQTRYKEMEAAYETELSSVLKPEQMKRLREVALRMRGSTAFYDAGLRDALKLTAEQRVYLDVTLTRSREMRMELMRKNPPSHGLPLAEAETMRQEELERVLEVLTEDQKKIWAGMVGAPFKRTH